jgi:hypothetical protein
MTLLVCVITAVGCNRPVAASAEQAAPVAEYNNKTADLAIVGYNYTNRYIADFHVNSHSGGNIMASTPTSGGGGTVCCAPYIAGIKAYQVTVRWQASACMYHTYSAASKEVFDEIHPFYKEVEVPVTEAFKGEPKYMEVHFYPDGKVEVTVTDTESPPRLQLSDSRQDRSVYPRCPGDKKPNTNKAG